MGVIHDWHDHLAAIVYVSPSPSGHDSMLIARRYSNGNASNADLGNSMLERKGEVPHWCHNLIELGIDESHLSVLHDSGHSFNDVICSVVEHERRYRPTTTAYEIQSPIVDDDGAQALRSERYVRKRPSRQNNVAINHLLAFSRLPIWKVMAVYHPTRYVV